uniref:Uncharacterized protein n=1 Tax=Sphaeramia orbicularis TaxID=375764 RepID=A0A673BSS1_9TELE
MWDCTCENCILIIERQRVSWRRRWRCAGSRPTRAWRASSRSPSEYSAPGSAYPGPRRGQTREPRRGATSWS